MTTMDIPRARSPWRMRYNPFYLLSAMCMLGGLLAVTNSLSWSQIPLPRLLALIGTLNLYEFTLIFLAGFLIRRKLLRDGLMLLVLEAFFLFDVSFLNTEIATGYPSLGLWVNVALFVAACIKLRLIWLSLGQKPFDGKCLFVLFELLALFAIPIVLRLTDQGWVSARAMYEAWWIVAVLTLLGDVLLRYWPALPSVHPRTLTFLMVLPWLLFVGHLSILQYVYGIEFDSSNLTPIILSLAIIFRRSVQSEMRKHGEIALVHAILPIAAVLVSVHDTAPFAFHIGKSTVLTPEKIAIGSAYLTFIYLHTGAYAVLFLIAGGMWLSSYSIGPSITQVGNWTGNSWRQLSRIADAMLPKTALAWGVIAITAAFAFLGLGAGMSLRRRAHE